MVHSEQCGAGGSGGVFAGLEIGVGGSTGSVIFWVLLLVQLVSESVRVLVIPSVGVGTIVGWSITPLLSVGGDYGHPHGD